MNNINEILGEQKKLKCSLLLKWQSYNTSNHEQKQISKGLHMQGDMDMSALYHSYSNILLYGHVL
jgi:hypothetical protein